jgi:O-antigen/teichoic acid export membrane protein
MSDTRTENRLIAKNTLINYTTLFLSMFIGVFSSRFVLQALGASNYGLYNVVGGVIGLFTFVSGSLSATTVRFITFELGKKEGNPNRVFCLCNTLHIALAVAVFIGAEVIGVWYILNVLRVEPGREADAMFVFQISIVTSCLNITNTPYSSLFRAFEDFLFGAVVGISLRIFQLVGVILLLFYQGDALRPYAILMAVSSIASFCIYRFTSMHRWPEITHYHFIQGKNNYKPLIGFSGWTILRSLSFLARGQVSNMLINFFFGTVVNAAFAIGNSVFTYVTSFMSNFDGAVAPQLTKNVGGGNEQRTMSLIFNTCKICLLMALVVLFPLYAELPFILDLWLKDVPEGTEYFCYWILGLELTGAMCGGLGQYVNASGKIKWFNIEWSAFCFLNLIIAYVGFRWYNAPPYFISALFTLSDAFGMWIYLTMAHYILHFDSWSFAKFGYTRPGIIFVIMVAYLFLYKQIVLSGVLQHLLGIVVTTLFGIILAYFIGYNKKDRKKILSLVRGKASA